MKNRVLLITALCLAIALEAYARGGSDGGRSGSSFSSGRSSSSSSRSGSFSSGSKSYSRPSNSGSSTGGGFFGSNSKMVEKSRSLNSASKLAEAGGAAAVLGHTSPKKYDSTTTHPEAYGSTSNSLGTYGNKTGLDRSYVIHKPQHRSYYPPVFPSYPYSPPIIVQTYDTSWNPDFYTTEYSPAPARVASGSHNIVLVVILLFVIVLIMIMVMGCYRTSTVMPNIVQPKRVMPNVLQSKRVMSNPWNVRLGAVVNIEDVDIENIIGDEKTSVFEIDHINMSGIHLTDYVAEGETEKVFVRVFNHDPSKCVIMKREDSLPFDQDLIERIKTQAELQNNDTVWKRTSGFQLATITIEDSSEMYPVEETYVVEYVNPEDPAHVMYFEFDKDDGEIHQYFGFVRPKESVQII